MPRAGEVFWYATGRFYKTAGGELFDAGYFIHLQGIDGELFSGHPHSEATALFTFCAQPFRSKPITNGGLSIAVESEGTFDVYFGVAGATFDDPDTFRGGKKIATFQRVSIVATVTASSDTPASNVFTARLVWSCEFAFGDGMYDFARLVPNGITQWGVASADPVPPPGGYVACVPFAGSAITIG